MLAEVAAEVQAFALLRPDWDEQGAPAIDPAAISTGLELLRSIEGVALRRQVRWRDPQVAPDSSGGVDLHFSTAEGWLLLSIEPGALARVCVVTQQEGEEPRLRCVSLAEATEAVTGILEPLRVGGVREVRG